MICTIYIHNIYYTMYHQFWLQLDIISFSEFDALHFSTVENLTKNARKRSSTLEGSSVLSRHAKKTLHASIWVTSYRIDH